ncbi:MAG: hypothetical protein IKU61_00900 [Clostridia bacterium]|nr:hypothetical protein [Clostridia bacterium]
MSVNEKMTAIADAIREKTGGTDALTLDGMAEAVQNVYDKGKQAEQDAFWDVFQNKGGEANYRYAFCYSRFDDTTYNPKYDIKCTNVTTSGEFMFYSSPITDTKVGIYAPPSNISSAFKSSDLVTIRLLHMHDTTTSSGAFADCTKLKNITISGTIGKAISFQDCNKLTHESLMSIIEHLGTVTSALTCALGTTNLAKLTDAEKAIATQKGWTLA